MKQLNKKLSEFAKQILENQDGSIEGGFTVINLSNNTLIIGGTETNNCNGGNCVEGCGQNTVAGCGGAWNTVPHCGVKS